MSYSIALTKKNMVRSRIQERVLTFFLIFAIILFGTLYIIQAISVATEGHRVQKHKSEIEKLQSKNKNIELELSGAQSLSFLEEKIEGLNMVRAEIIEYLSPISEVAAK